MGPSFIYSVLHTARCACLPKAEQNSNLSAAGLCACSWRSSRATDKHLHSIQPCCSPCGVLGRPWCGGVKVVRNHLLGRDGRGGGSSSQKSDGGNRGTEGSVKGTKERGGTDEKVKRTERKTNKCLVYYMRMCICMYLSPSPFRPRSAHHAHKRRSAGARCPGRRHGAQYLA